MMPRRILDFDSPVCPGRVMIATLAVALFIRIADA